MKPFSLFIVVLAVISLTACINETAADHEDFGEVQTIMVIGPAPIQFEAIAGEVGTKGTSVQEGNALLFGWAVGDTLGIFPHKGNQVEFPIFAAQGSTSASFDGGGWALRNNASYAAYYPFSVWNYHRDNETILLDYSGQVQNGNGSFDHLSAYDFLASNKTTPINSSVTFQMERQGAILYIDIVVPEPETITALSVSCDEAIFVEKAALDLSGDTPVVTPLETKTSLSLTFENTETTTDNETVRAYMAVQPLDFSDKTVTAKLYTETGSYEAPVTSRVVNKGRAAFLRFSDDFTPVNIEFADAEVKRICVENWDTNGDGELSHKEAAAVTDLGYAFMASVQSPNSLITSFEELQYFTGLNTIGYSAFYYCTNLQSVNLPEGVTSIGDYAFSFSKLTSITIPEGVTNIGEGAFDGCDNLAEFSGKFASNDQRCLIVDGELVSFASSGVTSYTIPEWVVSIGNSAFSRCSGLTSITIPESVTSIGRYAFHDCYRLTQLTIPESVTSIGEEAFWGCSNLTSITIPEGVTSIGYGAFFTCYSLTSITIPESVTSIGYSPFRACRRLAEFNGKFASTDHRCLIVDDALIAFAPSGLTSYIIPDGVSSIGREAFEYCRNLTSITIPAGVTSIGPWAFSNCSNLTSIVIPEGVTSIDNRAFYGSAGLLSITCMSVTPPSLNDSVFEDTNNCPIYVPNESVESYKTALKWSAYADRIFGIDVNGSVVGPDPQNPD